MKGKPIISQRAKRYKTMRETTKVFLNTWGLYNMSYEPQGEIGDKWGYLGYGWMTAQEAIDFMDENPERDGGEWFIADIDNYLHIKLSDNYDYCNVREVCEQIIQLEELDDEQLDIIRALVNDGYEVDEALDKLDDVFIYYDVDDMADVAEQYAEESGLLDSVPESLRNYFDFDALGRDMDLEGHYIFTENGNCLQVA